jgi:16S rRNA (cytidine1402-2'-O)-methyltransferase
MLEVFGNRKISIARELTKTYEEIITSDLNSVIKIVDEREENNNPLKGEVILIIDGYVKKKI